MPTSGRDRLSRLFRTFVKEVIVSPWKTGLRKTQSVMPRLPTVVPSVVSSTDTPIIRPSVKIGVDNPLSKL